MCISNKEQMHSNSGEKSLKVVCLQGKYTRFYNGDISYSKKKKKIKNKKFREGNTQTNKIPELPFLHGWRNVARCLFLNGRFRKKSNSTG